MTPPTKKMTHTCGDRANPCEPIKVNATAPGSRPKKFATRNFNHESELSPALKMGKSLVAARNLPAGTVMTPDDVAMKSPGGGLPPYELENVIGARLKAQVEEDEPLDWGKLELLKRA